METKICESCNQELNIDKFYKQKYKNRSFAICKKCANKKTSDILHKEYDENLIKTCKICDKKKFIKDFQKYKRGKYGVDGVCKQCRSVKAKIRYSSRSQEQ